MNEFQIQSGAVGAFISLLLTMIVYFVKKDKRAEEKALDAIPLLTTEIAALKSEIRVVRDAYAIVTSAAEKIILLKSALDAAFRKIDELKKSTEALGGLRDALQLVEISNDDNARLILARLHLLKRAVERIGGNVDHVAWTDPHKIDELKKGD